MPPESDNPELMLISSTLPEPAELRPKSLFVLIFWILANVTAVFAILDVVTAFAAIVVTIDVAPLPVTSPDRVIVWFDVKKLGVNWPIQCR